jgi:uncharacterized protein (DUF2461 family)
VQGHQLTRVPKGFAADHPAADLLRFKQLYLYVELEPDLATTRALESEVVNRFRAMTPFVRFLTEAVAKKNEDVSAKRRYLDLK